MMFDLHIMHPYIKWIAKLNEGHGGNDEQAWRATSIDQCQYALVPYDAMVATTSQTLSSQP